MAEQVAAEQCGRLLFEEDPGVPSVGHVGRVDPPQSLTAQVEDLAVGQRRPGRAGGLVHAGDQRPERPHGQFGVRRRPEPVVQRPGLVGLPVPEAHVPDPLQRDDFRHRRRHQREHLPGTGVEQQRVVADDEELVEREAAGHGLVVDSR
jgi:hypothetical protein